MAGIIILFCILYLIQLIFIFAKLFFDDFENKKQFRTYFIPAYPFVSGIIQKYKALE